MEDVAGFDLPVGHGKRRKPGLSASHRCNCPTARHSACQRPTAAPSRPRPPHILSYLQACAHWIKSDPELPSTDMPTTAPPRTEFDLLPRTPPETHATEVVHCQNLCLLSVRQDESRQAKSWRIASKSLPSRGSSAGPCLAVNPTNSPRSVTSFARSLDTGR